MTNGIDDVLHVPGLQSVASATSTPASTSPRPSGYGERVENSTPGSSVATVVPAAPTRASTSAPVRKVQWSTLAAPSSTARRTPGPADSWLPCTRRPSPASRPATSTRRASSSVNAYADAGSQNTSTQRACGAQAASIGPQTRSR